MSKYSWEKKVVHRRLQPALRREEANIAEQVQQIRRQEFSVVAELQHRLRECAKVSVVDVNQLSVGVADCAPLGLRQIQQILVAIGDDLRNPHLPPGKPSSAL